MARQETVLSVFVASPNDVEEERNSLEDVIRDLNRDWSRDLGVRLDLLRWETHAYPDIGDDSQAVINEQISQDYEFFIGIMWCTAGTPTRRAVSGTIEEFNLAKARYDKDSNSVKIMFYFKEAPIAPSDIDPKQIQLVSDFRSNLGEEGALYWSFKTTDEFTRLVRRHLNSQVREWKKRNAISAPVESGELGSNTINMPNDHLDERDEEEFGLLDLEIDMENQFAALQEVTERISDATQEVGSQIEERSQEIKQIQNLASQVVDRRAFHRILTRAASDMQNYASRMEAELPLFSEHLAAGMLSFGRLVPILMALPDDQHEDNREKMNKMAKELYETMESSENGLGEFHSSVSSLPSMTTRMNRARRATAKVLQSLIEAIRSARVELSEVEQLTKAN